MSATKELAALTYGMFVFCEAAEIMLEHAFKENNFTADDLRHEETINNFVLK